MKNKNLLLIGIGLLSIILSGVFSCKLEAKTQGFDVILDITNVGDDLLITEVRPLKFPEIAVDDSLKKGAKCYTSSGEAHNSSLCRNVGAGAAKRISGIYEISGEHSVIVDLSLSAPQDHYGVRFFTSWHPSDTGKLAQKVTLSTVGKASVIVHGMLELVDLNEIKTANKDMVFHITATYE